MLFRQLYNWIKYKTLPPSFLFKNRLFIERDSKHKRILTNFGFSFRNSKWSNYSNYNINFFFQNFFFFSIKYFFLILIFFLIVIFKDKLYLNYYFDIFFLFFWLTLEIFQLYFLFFIWLFWTFFLFFFNFIFSIFSNNFFLSISKQKNLNDENFKNIFYKKFEIQNNNSSSHLLIYSWLLQSFQNKNKKTKDALLTSIFNLQLNTTHWQQFSTFFYKLFKITFFLNLNSNANFFTYNSNFYTHNFNKIYADFFFFDKLINQKHLPYSFFFFLNKNNLSINNHNVYYSNSKKYFWNFFKITPYNTNFSSIFYLKNNFFYLNNLNTNSLKLINKNFWQNNLQFLFYNQFNAKKLDRWLYKYSILHRKILTYSNKLTINKSFLSSLNFDKKLFKKNLWTSENLTNYNQKTNFFSSFFQLNSYFAETNNNLLFNKKKLNFFQFKNKEFFSNLSLLTFYENSYFWFLKKFYLYNSFNKNIFNNTLFPKNTSFNKKNYLLNESSFLNYKYLLENSIKLKIFHLSDVTIEDLFFHKIIKNKPFFNKTSAKNPSIFLNDIFIYFENTEIHNENNSILTFLTTTNNNKNNNNINYFNYLINTNNSNFTPNSFSFFKQFSKKKINHSFDTKNKISSIIVYNNNFANLKLIFDTILLFNNFS